MNAEQILAMLIPARHEQIRCDLLASVAGAFRTVFPKAAHPSVPGTLPQPLEWPVRGLKPNRGKRGSRKQKPGF